MQNKFSKIIFYLEYKKKSLRKLMYFLEKEILLIYL